MTVLLEDFGTATASPATRPMAAPAAPAGADRFDDGYNAGWDDAVAQTRSEQGAIGARLAERLEALGVEHESLRQSVIADLEPMLREVFDKVLPRAVERSFHATLLEEAGRVLDAASERIDICVSPEDVPAMARLLQEAEISESRATVTGEPALAMSQALIRWTGQERRIDLDGVLGDMDAALDTYFATLDRGQNAAVAKEA